LLYKETLAKESKEKYAAYHFEIFLWHIDLFLTSVADPDPDPVGSGPFWSDSDPDPDVWDRIRFQIQALRNGLILTFLVCVQAINTSGISVV
jgi:hypothetical protein